MEWLRLGASRAAGPADLLATLCQRLDEAGMRLTFAALEVATLHPLMASSTYEWRADRRQALEMPRFHQPLEAAAAAGHVPSRPLQDEVHHLVDLSDPHGTARSALLAELHRQGATAYLARAVTFSDGSRHSLGFATGQPGGFAPDQAALLGRVAERVAGPLEILALRQMASTLLTTYLGRRTGQRVLDGLIQRGDGETVHAVLWYSDLRGFTALSQALPRDAVLALLNGHFERLVAPIKAFGGEVLKFIGDGLLAIFPIDQAGSASRACDQALKAVRSARAGMAALNDERGTRQEPALEFGTALHLGDVMYGNIGAPDRLDFTVIGPTVNLASRLEGQCKRLGLPVLASAPFAEHCTEALHPCGVSLLAGLAEPVAIFTLAEFAPRPAR
jgi:adenylate cyclase